MELIVDSQESLNYAANFFHDAKCYLRKILHDKKRRIFLLWFDRIKWNDTKININLIFFQLCSAPRMMSTLCFNQINDSEIHVKNNQFSNGEPVDFINTIKYDSLNKEIRIKCINGSVINLLVDTLDGTISDVNENPKKTHFINLFGIKIGGQ